MKMKTSLHKDASWGFLGQALQSIINLSAGLFLVKFATKEEYGIYGIGFAVSLLFVGFANAIVMTQMTVIAPSKPDDDRERYCGSMLLAAFAIVLPVSLLVWLCSYLPIDGFSDKYRDLLAALSLAIPGFVIVEFLRRYFYLSLAVKNAFYVDASLLILFSGMLSVIYFSDLGDLHFWVLSAYGISALIVAAVFLRRVVRFPLHDAFRLVPHSMTEAWKQGKWALGGVTVTSIQNQGYVYLLALLQGAASVAEANAARLFLSPLSLLSTSLSRVFMPRMAILRAEGHVGKAVKLSVVILCILLACILIYTGALLSSIDWILSVFATPEYQSIGILVALWALFIIGNSLRNVPTQLLQISHKFRMITLSSTVTAVLVLLLSILSIRLYGICGLIIVMALGELVLAVILMRYFNRVRQTG